MFRTLRSSDTITSYARTSHVEVCSTQSFRRPAGVCGAENETCHRPCQSNVIRPMPYSTGIGRDKRKRTGPSFATLTVAHLRLSLRTTTSLMQNPSCWNRRRLLGLRWVPPHQLRMA